MSPRRTPWRAVRTLIYGAYVWLTFAALGFAALLGVAVVPGLDRRRRLARGAARLVLRLAGLEPAVKSMGRVPEGQCVIVANHASYLDGVLMKAVLPPRFSFVIKREMAGVPLAGFFLRRIGSEFVERFDRQRSAADARRVLRNAERGRSLVFFPEGTFSPRPGLLRFHTGAFATAARAGCPVVPAVIRGTRAALAAGRLLPRRAPIEVEFLPAIVAQSIRSDVAAVELRDRSRSAILEALGEPDLAADGEAAPEPGAARAASGGTAGS